MTLISRCKFRIAVLNPRIAFPAFPSACAGLCIAIVSFLLLLTAPMEASAAGRLAEFLAQAQPGELFEGADRFGDVEGDPPLAPVYRGDELAGYAF